MIHFQIKSRFRKNALLYILILSMLSLTEQIKITRKYLIQMALLSINLRLEWVSKEHLVTS